jgi:hypothetical protein
MAYVVLSVRCLLGAVFVMSAASKLRSRAAFDEFAASVRRVGVADRLVRPVAVIVAAVEVLIPVLLAVPVTAPAPTGGVSRLATGAGLALAAGLLSAFAVAILAALRRGVRAPCRCFGTSSTPLGFRHVARNSALVVAAAIGLAALTSVADGAVQPGNAAIAAATGLVGAVLVTALDDLVELLSPSKQIGS